MTAFNYKTPKILTYKVTTGSNGLYLSTNSVVKDKKITDLINDFKKVKYGSSRPIVLTKIECSTLLNINYGLPQLLIPKIFASYSDLHTPFIYACKIDGTGKYLIDYKGDPNYGILENNRGRITSKDDNDVDRCIIPYYSSSDKKIYIHYNKNDSGTKNNLKTDIEAIIRTGRYFIVENKRNKSFILQGAVSFVNVIDVIESTTVNFCYKYDDSSTTLFSSNKTGVKILVVEVIYTGNKGNTSD